jgi:hypothetical protein
MDIYCTNRFFADRSFDVEHNRFEQARRSGMLHVSFSKFKLSRVRCSAKPVVVASMWTNRSFPRLLGSNMIYWKFANAEVPQSRPIETKIVLQFFATLLRWTSVCLWITIGQNLFSKVSLPLRFVYATMCHEEAHKRSNISCITEFRPDSDACTCPVNHIAHCFMVSIHLRNWYVIFIWGFSDFGSWQLSWFNWKSTHHSQSFPRQTVVF